MKGYPYRQPRCKVCGSQAYAGTQARPLCFHCETRENEIHELLKDIPIANPCPDGLASNCLEQHCPCRTYGRWLAKIAFEAEMWAESREQSDGEGLPMGADYMNPDVWVNNFMSKVNPPLAEMRHE